MILVTSSALIMQLPTDWKPQNLLLYYFYIEAKSDWYPESIAFRSELAPPRLYLSKLLRGSRWGMIFTTAEVTVEQKLEFEFWLEKSGLD